jgi:transposase
MSAHKSDVVLEMRRVRKRGWTTEEKVAILREGMAPGAVRADVMRRHGISSSLFYTWRKELTAPPAGFAAVQIAEPSDKAEPETSAPASRIEIVTAAGTSVRIDGAVDARVLAVVLKALQV